MLYEIKQQQDKDFLNYYFYQSKNEAGQTIRCECFQTSYDKHYF